MVDRISVRSTLLAVVGCALMVVSFACSNDRDEESAMLSGPITMEISGGVAGLSESVVVDVDGTVTRSRGRMRETTTMAREELTRLARLVDAQDLFAMRREYVSRGADLRTYTLTHRGVTIVADEGGMPPEVAALVELLESASRR